MALLAGRRFGSARAAAGLAVAAVAWGWAAAQYPYLLPPEVRIGEAAAGSATLEAMLVALLVGSVLLAPSLLFLYLLFQRRPHGLFAPGLPDEGLPDRAGAADVARGRPAGSGSAGLARRRALRAQLARHRAVLSAAALAAGGLVWRLRRTRRRPSRQ